jgi:ATP synthase F0 subunit c
VLTHTFALAASSGVGAGLGIGITFGKVIESVARQPEMRDEITQIQWLGFALTEATFLRAGRRADLVRPQVKSRW